MRKAVTEAHAHIALDGINFKDAVSLHSGGADRRIVDDRLKLYQDYGITYIRDGGDNLNVSRYARQKAAEYGINYRTPVFALYKKGGYGSVAGRSFSDMKEFRALVKEAVSSGADFIKIMGSGIMDFNNFGSVSESGLSAAEIKEIINIIHNEGKSAMVHANTSQIVGTFLECGADSIEHGYYISTETVKLFAETKALWVPTLAPVMNLFGYGFDDSVLKRIADQQYANLAFAAGIGVNLALGSDAGAVCVPHCEGLIDEYNYFCSAVGQSDADRLLDDGEKILKEKF